MAQYIPKDALVAEIEKFKAEALQKKSQCKRHGLEKIMHQISAYNKVLSFINTLEVKEVDLEKEIKDYFDSQPIITRSKGVDYRLIPTGVDIAKHFYELGLKAQKGEEV